MRRLRIATLDGRPLWRDPVWGLLLTGIGSTIFLPPMPSTIYDSPPREPSAALYVSLALGLVLLTSWFFYGVAIRVRRRGV